MSFMLLSTVVLGRNRIRIDIKTSHGISVSVHTFLYVSSCDTRFYHSLTPLSGILQRVYVVLYQYKIN
jgi:hypothetical protein